MLFSSDYFAAKACMSYNPSTPPSADVDGVLEKTPFDFSAQVEYSFTPQQLWWAGVCCVLGVVLTLPYFVLVYMTESMPALKFASLATAYVMTTLSIYVYLIFKKLLIEKSRYRGASLAISIYIVASIVTVLTAPFYDNENPSTLITVVSVAQLVVFGGLAIYLGVMLLRCEDPLFGQLKTVAYLTIAMGIALTSVVLALLGILLSFPLGIALAKLFFRASKALTQART